VDVTAMVRRHPLATYLLLTFAVSWSWWIPLALTGGDGTHLPGLAGPGIAGLVTTALLGGRDATRRLGRRIVRWRVPVRWYVAALAPAVIGVLALGVGAVLGRGLPSWDALAAFPGVPAVGLLGVYVLVLVVNGYGEEVGWRGVAWPLLRARHGLVTTAGLVAVPWALWHLPLFWIDTGLGDLSPLTIPGWLLGLAAGSLVLGWLCERADGSLLVVALFHTNLNLASATDAMAGMPAAAVSAGVIAAAVVLLRHQGDADRASGPVAMRRGRPAAS
jgi:membrane protease YdiL (CAAX protease family)